MHYIGSDERNERKKKKKKKKKTNLQIRATRYCDRSGADGGPTRSADEMQRSGFGEGFQERETHLFERKKYFLIIKLYFIYNC